MDIYSCPSPNPHEVSAVADMENIPPLLPFNSQTRSLCSDGIFASFWVWLSSIVTGLRTPASSCIPPASELSSFLLAVLAHCQDESQAWEGWLGWHGLTVVHFASFLLPCGCLLFSLPYFLFHLSILRGFLKQAWSKWIPSRTTARRQMKEDPVTQVKCETYLHGPMQRLQG